jgi:hypothetical protein
MGHSRRVEGALEWVLGDRQRQETRINSLPSGDSPLLRQRMWLHDGAGGASSADAGVTLRVYVATRHGTKQLIDDRQDISASRAQRIEIVEAEYAATDLTPPMGASAVTAAMDQRILCHSACKGEMLYLLAQDNKQRSRRDYVAFVDDDVAVRVSGLLAGAEQASMRGCPIFQLQLSHDSYAVWPQLKQRKQADQRVPAGFAEQWSWLPFVEIMAPVIAQRELDLGLLDLLEPFKSGFGWDFYLIPCLTDLYDDFRPGLFRGATMEHRRAINTNNQTTFSNGLTALQEEELIRAGLALTLIELNTYHGQGRAQFLGQLSKTLGMLQNETGSEALRGVASALLSVTQRYWLCRQLEEQNISLLEEQSRLQQSLEQQEQHLSDVVAELETRSANFRSERASLEQQIRGVEDDQQTLLCQIDAMHKSVTWKLGRLCLSPIRFLRRLLSACAIREH